MQPHTYNVKSKVWKWQGFAGWHFVSLSKKQSAEISKLFSEIKRGFGSLPVLVTLGKSRWKTSIFPNSKDKTYLLALKAKIRKQENIKTNQVVKFTIEILGL